MPKISNIWKHQTFAISHTKNSNHGAIDWKENLIGPVPASPPASEYAASCSNGSRYANQRQITQNKYRDTITQLDGST